LVSETLHRKTNYVLVLTFFGKWGSPVERALPPPRRELLFDKAMLNLAIPVPEHRYGLGDHSTSTSSGSMSHIRETLSLEDMIPRTYTYCPRFRVASRRGRRSSPSQTRCPTRGIGCNPFCQRAVLAATRAQPRSQGGISAETGTAGASSKGNRRTERNRLESSALAFSLFFVAGRTVPPCR